MILLAALVAVLAVASPPTLADLEDEVVCPTCQVTLDQSNAPIADRMRAYIRERIAAGDSKEEIKAKLVEQFGPRVLAVPERRGFDLIAWLLPIGGAVLGAAVLGALAWRWSRTPGREAGPLAPELERRVEDELARFDG
ncbi:MAG: cytochrome c-type biogenesis protein CcmH [Thermoleophilia bacterium]|nr:cytochrome c-type biogenesis protein CcmH [Thermoleophilia bacterium]